MEKRGAVFEQRRPCQARCRAAFLSFARPTTEQQRNTKMMTFLERASRGVNAKM
jgi:hypothetical protein